uniref:JAB domain-containing protein n=1 Tax=Xanthomonas cannabis TaxID=1885674 RepID=UPI003F4BB891
MGHLGDHLTKRLLEAKNRFLVIEELLTGSLDIYQRVATKRSPAFNAVAVILFRNHPSGNPEPSEADRQVTECLQQALGLLDIEVMGHLEWATWLGGAGSIRTWRPGGGHSPLPLPVDAGSNVLRRTGATTYRIASHSNSKNMHAPATVANIFHCRSSAFRP